MDKKELYALLGRFVSEKPELCAEIEEFVKKVIACGEDQAVMELLTEFKTAHPEFADLMKACAEEKEAGQGKVFPVHKPFTSEIRERMKLAKRLEHFANWSSALKSLPEKTLPLPVVDSEFIRRAKEIWKQDICGNDELFRVMLRHCIEYSKKGTTSPILLLGDPGIGKTLAAKTYGKIMNLPCSFLSGPNAASGRGLSGAPNIYAGAGVGAVVQAMIDHKAGNPVLVIDELDKTGTAIARDHVFQDELLSMMDESSETWYDNFLEIEVDASHIPLVLTANKKEPISQPLLDRMEVVRMEAPTKEMLHSITREFTLPKTMSMYDDGRVSFPEQEVDMLVDMLWDAGNHSCRAYQTAVSILVSDAYLDSLEKGADVRISEESVKKTAALWRRNAKGIGFVA